MVFLHHCKSERTDDNGGICGGLTAESPANIQKKWKIGMENITKYLHQPQIEAGRKTNICMCSAIDIQKRVIYGRSDFVACKFI